ncbi:MAG TPA: hypothetical protein VFQ94_02645, partial [Gallionella sp.]|nr:hypothetical protein [Gallionella sp.]
VSLAKVARNLGLHRTTLERSHPELADHIIDRYQRFRKESIAQKRTYELNLAKEMLEKLKASGMTLTQRNFSRLTNQCLLPRTYLWTAIKVLLVEEHALNKN